MPRSASSTATKKKSDKKPAKKAATKRTPAARSGPVEVKTPPLRDRLHPGLLASALDLADGDTRKIEAVSYTSVMVTL